MNTRELFEATRLNETPPDVYEVSCSAAENAVATIKENGGQFLRGEFTDEFMGWWLLSVQGLLCGTDCTQEAREWFEAAGVTY